MFLREIFDGSELTIYEKHDDQNHIFLKTNSYLKLFKKFEEYFTQIEGKNEEFEAKSSNITLE